MTKTRKQRDQEERVARQQRMLAAALGNKVICEACGATLETFDNACSAELDVWCDGFLCIELVLYPDERNAGDCSPDQIARCRAIIEAPK